MDLGAIALSWRALPGVGQPMDAVGGGLNINLLGTRIGPALNGQVVDGQVTLGANRFFGNSAKMAAMRDMAVEDTAELSDEDRSFYSPPHNNSLQSLAPSQGYTLRDRAGNILKFGETTQGTRRYSRRYLKSIGADPFFEASGSKAEMYEWQHQQILLYKATHGGARPPLNKSDC
jgi:hypothetical protein